jgi:predicted nucleotidyltransferase
MTLNKDYRDLLSALSEEKVEFLLIGAYALSVHGFPRATMDIDFWIKSDALNAEATMMALNRFGAPTADISAPDFLSENMVFQIGVVPRRIEIVTSIDGLKFDEAFSRSETVEIDGIPVHVLSVADLIINKRATGRTKDLADAEMLEGQEPHL